MKDMATLSMDGLYPVHDLPTNIEEISITDVPVDMLENVRAFWNHAERCPRKGEWYLKGGSELKAYRATEDLDIRYPIAELAITEPINERRIIRIITK